MSGNANPMAMTEEFEPHRKHGVREFQGTLHSHPSIQARLIRIEIHASVHGSRIHLYEMNNKIDIRVQPILQTAGKRKEAKIKYSSSARSIQTTMV